MTPEQVLKLMKDNDAKFVDLRFTDTRGKEQHVTMPASVVDEDLFEGHSRVGHDPHARGGDGGHGPLHG